DEVDLARVVTELQPCVLPRQDPLYAHRPVPPVGEVVLAKRRWEGVRRLLVRVQLRAREAVDAAVAEIRLRRQRAGRGEVPEPVRGGRGELLAEQAADVLLRDGVVPLTEVGVAEIAVPVDEVL